MEYGPLSRALHHLALGLRSVSEMSFDIERGRVKPDRRSVAAERHVFVSGLARAGTTILMRRLHDVGLFRSLTYRDMPFVLMPGTWARLSGSFRARGVAAERSHGDGLLVDFDSPEAFEEVFWRTFCSEDYIRADRLVPHTADAETTERFRDYVGMILASAEDARQTRYLSKNNNNLLRLPSIAAALPRALILLPFRDPVQQAHSLLRQHEAFSERHSADRFALRYMSWLGHHEFGGNHKPIRRDGSPDAGDPRGLDYWVRCWTEAYGLALDTAPDGTLFVSYETLCRDPDGQFRRIFAAADIPADRLAALEPLKEAAPYEAAALDPGVRAAAYDLYGRLQERAARG